MTFRQLFDEDSYTYSYVIGSSKGKALIIDPVKDKVEQYLQLLDELDLKLCMAIDTHIHADHITALGDLRDATGCESILGNKSKVDCVSRYVTDNEVIQLDEITLKAIYTPGHTDDSFCFLMQRKGKQQLFSGDTLLIRGTGRTDFQNGNAEDLYESLTKKILTLDKDTQIFPGHDYKGWTMSTIEEEIQFSERLNLPSKKAFVQHMNDLKIPNPKMMDIAVPANLKCGNMVNKD
ncbi:MAG TPA: MBL fold metallo-hydrolase [Gammaproteobacteria bacterium]|jgi:glyoxylase-like metal-dependent hydrolase (beta-lactamase superfamily II)|nr:MBL fold metallo-hydrolase [Gammaproteobacteria bacterium]HIK72781.1 MBL fold metallo-hydrolase [Gammaproteobacteria bacterium]